MNAFELAVICSALLCSIVAGFLFAFASVAMPGIRTMSDREFLRAFKAMDRVIQDKQPAFMLVWVGSVLALGISAVLSLWGLNGAERVLIISATVVYLLGVQMPTATVNVPLNNQLQAQDLEALNESAVHSARIDFERRWVRWNAIRTIFATSTSALLMILLLRL